MNFTEAEAKAKVGLTVRLRQPLHLHTGVLLPVGSMGRVIDVEYVDPEGTGDEFKGKPYGGGSYIIAVRWDIPGEPLSHFDTKDYWHFLEEV